MPVTEKNVIQAMGQLLDNGRKIGYLHSYSLAEDGPGVRIPYRSHSQESHQRVFSASTKSRQQCR